MTTRSPVVLDTNILVAAARSRHGASHLLLSRIPDPRWHPVFSVPLFAAFEAVLRPENLSGRAPALVEGFLDNLFAVGRMHDVFFLWRRTLPDPDDDMLLGLALAARSRYIATYNLRDFRGCRRWGVFAVTPAQFLEEIERP